MCVGGSTSTRSAVACSPNTEKASDSAGASAGSACFRVVDSGFVVEVLRFDFKGLGFGF